MRRSSTVSPEEKHDAKNDPSGIRGRSKERSDPSGRRRENESFDDLLRDLDPEYREHADAEEEKQVGLWCHGLVLLARSAIPRRTSC